MTADEIRRYLAELDEELRKTGVRVGITLRRRCHVPGLRCSARDLPDDWLNGGVKGYLVEDEQRVLFELPNLIVFVPKLRLPIGDENAFGTRADTFDRADVRVLIKKLGLSSPAEVFAIVENY